MQVSGKRSLDKYLEGQTPNLESMPLEVLENIVGRIVDQNLLLNDCESFLSIGASCKKLRSATMMSHLTTRHNKFAERAAERIPIIRTGNLSIPVPHVPPIYE